MRLGELLTRAGIDAPDGVGGGVVARLAYDSREVSAGTVFVAIRGERTDGHDYAAAAAKDGAVVVIAERPLADVAGVPVVVVPNTRVALARLARVYHRLDEAFAAGLRVIGITGTNGKTTTTYLLQSIVRAAGHDCGRMGTIDYDLVDRSIPAPLTTPDSLVLSEQLAEMHASGVGWAAMEVSSHGLDQDRVAGIDFSAGVFTNLSGDHLDYHGDMKRYLAAKVRLFSGLSAGAWAIVNADDPHAEGIKAASPRQQLTYGLSSLADVHCQIERIAPAGTSLVLRTPAGTASVSLKLTGRHNVYNALAAAAAAEAMGIELPTIAAGLASLACVPGRLERVDAGDDGPTVLVDYAHTDDALANVLSSLKPLTRGKLLCVFGCGGDRDRTKRPRMAKVAEAHANTIIVTSDNPRTESPQGIIEEIVAGFSPGQAGKVRVEPDRAAAIAAAIREAKADDVVLIAGKGHEPYQLVGAERLPFDDRDVARKCLAT